MSSQQSFNAVLELILDRIVVSLPGNKGVGRSEKLLKQFHDENNKLVLSNLTHFEMKNMTHFVIKVFFRVSRPFLLNQPIDIPLASNTTIYFAY